MTMRTIPYALALVTGLACPVAAQSSFLSYDVTARQCLIDGRDTSCPVSIVAYCERHRDEIVSFMPGMVQNCVRAEQRQVRRVPPGCVPGLLVTGRPICNDGRLPPGLSCCTASGFAMDSRGGTYQRQGNAWVRNP